MQSKIVCGVFGHPVKQNLSQYMHNAAFAALGIDGMYVAFDVEPQSLPAAIRAIPALSMAGVNLSIPHKVAAMALVDEVSPKAQAIGAINTVVNRHGLLFGDNTDCEGFILDLKSSGYDPTGRSVVLLGAGGAARAICYALCRDGIEELWVIDTDRKRSLSLIELAEGMGVRAHLSSSQDCGHAVRNADLIVNATPVGMHPNTEASPVIDPDLIHSGHMVFDAIHNPPESRLVREARARGARARGGLGMLIAQGSLAFEIWTGAIPPREAMERALRDRIEGRSG